MKNTKKEITRIVKDINTLCAAIVASQKLLEKQAKGVDQLTEELDEVLQGSEDLAGCATDCAFSLGNAREELQIAVGFLKEAKAKQPVATVAPAPKTCCKSGKCKQSKKNSPLS